MAERRNSRSRSTPPPAREHLNYYALWMHGINALRNVLIAAIAGASLVGVVYTGIYLPVRDAPGNETILTITQKWAFEANLHVYLAWGAAAGGVGYGISERRKRLRERKERDTRIIELEKRIDPHRTSSGLTTEGERREKLP